MSIRFVHIGRLVNMDMDAELRGRGAKERQIGAPYYPTEDSHSSIGCGERRSCKYWKGQQLKSHQERMSPA
jgi:hypothetical protein